MISNKRRYFLITVSVLIGTVLATLMMMSRKGSLSPGDYGTLFINALLAGGIVIGIGIIFNKKKEGNR